LKNVGLALTKSFYFINKLSANTVFILAKGIIDVSPVKDKCESYIIQLVQNLVDGVSTGLVIVGSGKRGVIYGVEINSGFSMDFGLIVCQLKNQHF
jgi:hypothetical protein